MSWMSYVESLVAGGNVEKAAILGLDGAVWAQSDGICIGPHEAQEIVRGFSDCNNLQAKGICVSNCKYMFIVSDDKQMQGKKGPAGISIARSTKCVIVGVYKEGMHPGNSRKAVENMCDYLVSVGY